MLIVVEKKKEAEDEDEEQARPRLPGETMELLYHSVDAHFIQQAFLYPSHVLYSNGEGSFVLKTKLCRPSLY